MRVDAELHTLGAEGALQALEASPEGLTPAEAERRMATFGRNVLEEEEVDRLEVLVRQFNNPLIFVLLAATVIAALVGDLKDIIIIVIIIVLNGLLGFYQELKAEASVRALKRLTESRARVRRDGQEVEVPSSELVPGDVMLLREGNLVTVDARLLSSTGLSVDESPITGESVPIDKDHEVLLAPEALPFELRNMVLAGTSVVRGSAEALVARTGRRTYLASIAERAQERSPDSPLTKAISAFSKRYVSLLLVVFAVVGAVGLLQGRGALDVAYSMVAQLVSAVPEGLPIVVTIVLVVGALALSRRKTLARYLPAVETLGSATVIASDKTGTITEGRLSVHATYELDPEAMRQVAALCNDSDGRTGDPVDVALLRWVGESHVGLRARSPRLWAHPFDTKLRYMATRNAVGGKSLMMVKGAYEALRPMAVDGGDLDLLDGEVERMASEGLRVLALGVGEGSIEDPQGPGLRLVGLVGFLDPPKAGVREAVEAARRAGIRVIMITGDHPETARAVARDVGIWREGDGLLSGREVEAMADEALLPALRSATVLARILPEHKYRVVKVLQAGGEIVAVTGDGVNDVPALKAADLGIAMGDGTEAAKGVAKMVILDNDLGVIVEAIRNGRVIAANIRKVIYYLVSTSMGEIVLISSAIIAGLPLPLRPTQVLWVNLVTDGAQDKTFPFAKEEGDVMSRPPVRPDRQFFDRAQLARTAFFGLGMGMMALMMFVGLRHRYEEVVAGTITFTSVVAVQWANGIQAQKEREPFFSDIRRSLSTNPYIFLGAGAGFLLQLVAIYAVPGWFETAPLALEHWAYVVAAFAFMFCLVEVRKWAGLALDRRMATGASTAAAPPT